MTSGKKQTIAWNIFGRSVRGYSHERSGLPCQDCYAAVKKSNNYVLLAVSDGHGSPKCFRSDRGSKFAVEVAIEVIEKYLGSFFPEGRLNEDESDHSNRPVSYQYLGDITREKIPMEIVRQWQVKVQNDIQREQLKIEEMNKRDELLFLDILKKPMQTYGATLLIVLVTPKYTIYWQLGDGEIVTFSGTSEVIPVLARNEKLFGNETTSLCLPNAWAEFQVEVLPIKDQGPALILVSTDGYPNSFKNVEGFHQAGVDILKMLWYQKDGEEKLENHLADWLAEASKQGSGDDITVGLIWRNPTLAETEKDVCATVKEIHELWKPLNEKFVEFEGIYEKYHELKAAENCKFDS